MPKIIAPPENELNETIEKRPIITTCPHCQYTISYTEDEVDRVENDAMGVYCPQCGGVITTKHIEPFTFPDSFYSFNTRDGANSLTNEEIQHLVNIVKRQLQQEMKIEEYTFLSQGNTLVIGFKLEDEDRIVVVRDYWEDSVVR